jgi:hypothetical protein
VTDPASGYVDAARALGRRLFLSGFWSGLVTGSALIYPHPVWTAVGLILLGFAAWGWRRRSPAEAEAHVRVVVVRARTDQARSVVEAMRARRAGNARTSWPPAPPT